MMLSGEMGKSVEKAMKILLTSGEIYEAERMVKVEHCHISGISYDNIGDHGLAFLREFLKDVEFKTVTTINPMGMDRKKWRKMGIEEKFAKKQLEICNILMKSRADATFTCTPYHLSYKIRKDEHLAWAESSAVVYANSVIGARTNRESGITAICSAITGMTPMHGLHLKKNRAPKFLIEVRPTLRLTPGDFSLLGYFIGKTCKDAIPYIKIRQAIHNYELKTMGAAMAASGAVPMYHIEKITPEYRWAKRYLKDVEKIAFDENELNKVKEEVSCENSPDAYFFGCPHLSYEELKNLYSKNWKGKKVYLCTSRYVYDKFRKKYGIKKRNVKILCDTCVIVSPIRDFFDKIGVDSAKACFYLKEKGCFIER